MRDDPVSAPDLPISSRDFEWAVGSLCNLQRIMFDIKHVQGEFPPPHSAITLVDALRMLGLRVRIAQRDGRSVALARFPCLIFLQRPQVPSSQSDHAAEAADIAQQGAPSAPFGIALLVKSEGGRLLLFPAGTNEPKVFLATEFATLYAGYALEATNALEEPADDEAMGKLPAFGFRARARRLRNEIAR